MSDTAVLIIFIANKTKSLWEMASSILLTHLCQMRAWNDIFTTAIKRTGNKMENPDLKMYVTENLVIKEWVCARVCLRGCVLSLEVVCAHIECNCIFVYVCMYMYVYMCVYICMCVFVVCVRTYACIYVCQCVCR